MGNIGFPEMLVIFVIALLIFGPKRLPDLGKSLGKGLSEFRRASNDLKNTIEREIETANLEDVIKGNPVSNSEKTRVDDSKSRLPDLGKSLGKGLSEFRRASNDLKNTIEREIETANLEDVIKGNPVSNSEKTRVDDSKS